MKTKLLSIGNDAKTKKGEALGILTAILYLAPASEASKAVGRAINICPHASAGCKLGCLFKAGMGKFSNVINARVNKTVRLFNDREGFLNDLKSDLDRFASLAELRNMQGAVRLNGTSDLPWENLIDMEKWSQLAWYDYTKNPNRIEAYLDGKMPANYSLTFSLSESNETEARRLSKLGANIAVVFDDPPLFFWGKRVINGDIADDRFNDPQGVIVGLKAKGPALKDDSGFVQRIADLQPARAETNLPVGSEAIA